MTHFFLSLYFFDAIAKVLFRFKVLSSFGPTMNENRMDIWLGTSFDFLDRTSKSSWVLGFVSIFHAFYVIRGCVARLFLSKEVFKSK
jgi:hypothetical protein